MSKQGRFIIINTSSIVHGFSLGHVVGVYETLPDARKAEIDIVIKARGLWYKGDKRGLFCVPTIIVEVLGNNNFKIGNRFPEINFSNNKFFVNHG